MEISRHEGNDWVVDETTQCREPSGQRKKEDNVVFLVTFENRIRFGLCIRNSQMLLGA